MTYPALLRFNVDQSFSAEKIEALNDFAWKVRCAEGLIFSLQLDPRNSNIERVDADVDLIGGTTTDGVPFTELLDNANIDRVYVVGHITNSGAFESLKLMNPSLRVVFVEDLTKLDLPKPEKSESLQSDMIVHT